MIKISEKEGREEKKSLKEIVISEMRKCAIEPHHFIKKYCLIQHPQKGLIPFILYDYQEKTLFQFVKHRNNIILKARQLGISTLVAAYILWLILFHNDKNILVIATKRSVAKNIVTKVRIMFENLPSWLRIPTDENNKLGLRLVNGSQVIAESSSDYAGRSESLSLLVLDEAAWIEKIEDIWISSQQTLATGGDCIVLSTPAGTGNWFHRMWQRSQAKEIEFNTIKLHWSVHPDRDLMWRKRQTDELGDKKACQENDCDFITSGNTVISPDTLLWYEESCVKEPIEKRGGMHDLWIWESPKYDKSYITVADVARGDGSDYSAFHVLELETMNQVAEYKGMIGTTEFGNMLVNISTEYNDALLVIENLNIGWAVIQVAIDRKYKNLFYSSPDLMVVDVQQQLDKRYDLRETKLVPGFTTSTRTRPLIISKLDIYCRDKAVLINSKRTIDELWVFIWNGPKAEAQRGYNDDLVMALSIGLWIRDTALRLKNEGIELQKKTIEGFGMPENILSGRNEKFGDNPWKWKIGEKDEDLTWLI